MNSSPSSVMSRATPSHGSRMRENTPRGREATSPVEKLQAIMKTRDEEPVEHEAQVQVSADNLRDDLISMRKCLTCSICDQLLYEPWILQCGHTYCYSCLCQWFIPNKRKKTCPECRAPVKQIPAPAFLIKNMVEIFIQRGQLMPDDETIEQHKVKNAEETEIVEKDKNSPEGLFKGTFPLRHGELWHDEADGVMRCPSCGHEHEGGPTCDRCGAEFDDIYGFSDMDDDDGDLSDFDIGYGEGIERDHEDIRHELELEAELHRATEHGPNVSQFRHNPFAFGGPIHQHVLHHYHAHQRGHRVDNLNDDSEDPTNSDTSNQDNSDDEDAGSLEDFIANDDEDSESVAPPPRRARQRVVIISDDEDDDEDEDDEEDSDDEGGAITNRRRPRSGWAASSETPSRAISISAEENGSTPSRSILISDDDNGSSANGSEFGDEMVNHEARRLRASGGWSPLDEGEDDDTNRLAHGEYGDYTTTDDERASDESDSDTIGNPNSDGEEEDDRPRGGLRGILNYDYEEMDPNFDGFSSSVDGDATPIDYAGISDGGYNNHGSENEHYDYDTDGDLLPSMDRDGDTEMSVSPGVSRSSRDVSVESNLAENLGVANEVAGNDDDDDDSDSSIRPPPRRQPRNNAGHQQYNSRISMLFAEHQNTVRNARNPDDINYWEDENDRDIPEGGSSGNRRRTLYHHPLGPPGGNHHRTMQPLGIDRIRTSRGSSPPRPAPTYGRTGRSQRQ
ncbi:hypothetical protein BTUL_0248g00090 [Botrytis tulipae]|uniref:RING-type domain-containing protein n=1 Tax=Botrytis tulipae TaxID=87230 RepID=A0A4Z1E6W4_9HELO|nr:hypothetical protein BTUL_0248g00090 [Botrytis tulipae]